MRVQVMRMKETGEGWIGDGCAPVVLSQKHVGLCAYCRCVPHCIRLDVEDICKESPFGRRGYK